MRFIKTNTFTGTQLVWDRAYPGARAIKENGKPVERMGAPMLTMESETFAEMKARGASSTRSEGVQYTIEE